MSLYAQLLGQGWTMEAIDNMDILYYIRVLGYKATHPAKTDSQAQRPRREGDRAFIDEVWPL